MRHVAIDEYTLLDTFLPLHKRPQTPTSSADSQRMAVLRALALSLLAAAVVAKDPKVTHT